MEGPLLSSEGGHPSTLHLVKEDILPPSQQSRGTLGARSGVFTAQMRSQKGPNDAQTYVAVQPRQCERRGGSHRDDLDEAPIRFKAWSRPRGATACRAAAGLLRAITPGVGRNRTSQGHQKGQRITKGRSPLGCPSVRPESALGRPPGGGGRATRDPSDWTALSDMSPREFSWPGFSRVTTPTPEGEGAPVVPAGVDFYPSSDVLAQGWAGLFERPPPGRGWAKYVKVKRRTSR